MKGLYCLLFIVLGLGACKKDALEIKEEKKFVQPTTQPATNFLDGGISLTLKPDGTANFNPGGDIVWAATYNISGKKNTVYIQQTNTRYKFTIISDSEIHGEHNEILKLVTQ